MTQLLIGFFDDAAYMVGDSQYSARARGQSAFFRKVFRVNDDLLAASLGDAAGIHMILKAIKDGPVGLSEIAKGLGKEYLTYLDRSDVRKHFEKHPQPVQSFILLRREGEHPPHFALQDLTKSPDTTGFHEVPHKMLNDRFMVLGPSRNTMYQSVGPIADAPAKVLKDLHGSYQRCPSVEVLNARLSAALETSMYAARASQHGPLATVGGEMSGWLLRSCGPAEMLGSLTLPGADEDALQYYEKIMDSLVEDDESPKSGQVVK